MIRHVALTLLAAVAITTAAGCGDESSSPGGAASPEATPGMTSTTPERGAAASRATAKALSGRRFASTSAEGRDLVAGSPLELTFADGKVSGTAGCNRFFSTPYRVTRGQLELEGGVLGRTMMACAEPLMKQEEWFIALLEGPLDVVLEGDRLSLSGAGATVYFSEVSKIADPSAIIGTTWELVSTQSAGTAGSVPAGVAPPTLLIDDAGQATVFTGCNRGRGEATVRDDGTIFFGRLATTRRACPGDAGAIERLVLTVLRGEPRAGLDGGELTLSQRDDRLVFRPR